MALLVNNYQKFIAQYSNNPYNYNNYSCTALISYQPSKKQQIHYSYN
jgi:hypothetical protein